MQDKALAICFTILALGYFVFACVSSDPLTMVLMTISAIFCSIKAILGFYGIDE